MNRNHFVITGVFCTAVAAAPLLQGCASKGYVNNHIDELRQANRAELDGLKAETAQLRNSTEDALARANTASGRADEARELALGKAGLEELNRYTVFFRFDQDQIDDTETTTLDQAAAEIGGHPEAIVDVYGFADPTGPDRYNLELGERRAMEVMRYLAAADPNQLSRFAAVSYGERDLRGMTADSDEHSRQRRVVVSLIRRIPMGEGSAPSAEVVTPDR